MGVGMRDLAEDSDGGEDLAAEGVSRNELGSDKGVPVEVSLEDLSLDLPQVVVVGAPVELGDLLLEEAAVRSPLGLANGGDRHGG